MARQMRVVCSWCGALMHDGPPEPISHGMCERCKRKSNEEIAAERNTIGGDPMRVDVEQLPPMAPFTG